MPRTPLKEQDRLLAIEWHSWRGLQVNQAEYLNIFLDWLSYQPLTTKLTKLNLEFVEDLTGFSLNVSRKRAQRKSEGPR